MRVLIIEDDAMGALILERAVTKGGYEALIASDGTKALAMIQSQQFDALLVDLLLPELDGISLMKVVRQTVRPVPVLLVTTALTSPESRARALDAGADDYVTKPYDPVLILDRLEKLLARRSQRAPQEIQPVPTESGLTEAPFPVVMLAAGSGGPTALRQIFRQIPEDLTAAFFVVQQAPAQILETLLHLLKNETRRPLEIAEDGARIQVGHGYLAPADHHLLINDDLTISLSSGPLENYLRPSANPLFRSAARVFGRKSVAVVLSGLGIDGAAGAAQIASAGGLVLAQDPAEAVDPSMPAHIIQSGLTDRGRPLAEIVTTITTRVNSLQ